MTEKYNNLTKEEMIQFLEKQIEDRQLRLLNGIKWHLANDDESYSESVYPIISLLGNAVINEIKFEDKGRYLTSQRDADLHFNLPSIKEQVNTIIGLRKLIELLGCR